MLEKIKLNSSMKIEYVELVFENSESIVLPRFLVKELVATGIRSNLFYQDTFAHFDLSESLWYTCEEARLTIGFDDVSNLDYEGGTEVLGMFVGNETVNNVWERPEVLGRVMIHNDISHIDFLDKNKKSMLYLAVPWGDHDFINEYMKVVVDEKSKELHIHFSSKIKDEKEES